MSARSVRVVIADDHPVVLAGIEALVRTDPDIVIVATARDGEEACAVIESAMPDIAILDISMPGLSGLGVIEHLQRVQSDTRVLVLTVHEDRIYLQKVLQAGGRGYLLKRSAANELLRAVRVIAAGNVYIDPAIAQKMVAPRGMTATAGADLTNREEQVLRFAALGFANREIAEKMGLSVKTIETHKARAAEKLGLKSRAEIVRYALDQGWLERI